MTLDMLKIDNARLKERIADLEMRRTVLRASLYDHIKELEAQRETLRTSMNDNIRLRAAGCNLAEAALHVIRTFDGVHRLALAVAEWAQAVGCEGGRGIYKEEAPK